MAEKKEKEKKKYNFRQVLKCGKCGTVAEIPGPCLKCGNLIFTAVYEAQEIK